MAFYASVQLRFLMRSSDSKLFTTKPKRSDQPAELMKTYDTNTVSFVQQFIC